MVLEVRGVLAERPVRSRNFDPSVPKHPASNLSSYKSVGCNSCGMAIQARRETNWAKSISMHRRTYAKMVSTNPGLEYVLVSESNGSRISAIEQDIVDLTNDYWTKTGKAFLLATVGQQLTKRGYDLRTDLRRQKLVPFLQAQLSDKIAVLTSPFDPLVRGIVPKGEDAGKDIRTLFTRNVAGRSRRFNFNKRLWIAFSRPIAANHVRVIEFDPEIIFKDVPAEAVNQDGKLVISNELVIPPGSKPSEVRNAELQKNIRNWLESNDVSIEKAAATSTVDITRTGDDSLLETLLASLDKKDLERVVIPLDIVAKLLAQRLKGK